MARTPKRVVERNLLKVPVLIEDTVSYSKYFEVSRLDPNFHAGKNGFLIRGTQFLKNGTAIQVEVLDRYGKTVFSNVIGNYSEGDARLVSVEITQKTRKGPGKLVVVGIATNYEDGRPIPLDQQNSPNVRWVFPIDIDPSRRNTSKLILQNTPTQILDGLSVTRTDFNTISRTDAFVTNSTYTASLDYDFEGHRSDGYAITMLDNSGNATPFFDDVSIDGYFTGSIYKREISNLYDTGTLVPDSQSIVLNYVTASVYTPLFKTLNETLAITEKSIKFGNGDDFLNPILRSGSYSRIVTEDDLGGNLVRKLEEEITSSVIFEYPTETLTTSANNSSILNFRIPYTQTYTGEIAKVRISAKEANPEITAYQLLTEFNPGERNILVTGSNTGNVSIGRFLTDDRLQSHWQSGLVNITDYENSQSVNPITLVTSSAEILEGFYADHTESAVSYYFGTQEFYQLYEGVQYTLKYDAVYNPTYVSSSTTYSTTDTGSVKAYLTRIGSDATSKASSSVVIATKQGVTNTYGLLVDEVNTKDNDKGLYERQVNFTPERDGVAYLRYIVDSGFWNFSNFEITPAIEYGYNPDEIVVYAEDTILTGTTYVFKIEFIGWSGDISDEFISDPIEVPPKGGGSSIRLISDRQVFAFGSDGDPTPAQQTASVDVVLTNITSTPQFTLVDDDDVSVQTQFYSASNGNINIELYHTAFGAQTASLNPDPTGSILLTVSASAGGDIFTDKIRFNRVKDAADGTPGEQGPTGAAGTDAKTVKITLSDYSVVYDQGGVNPTPTSITASAQQQNLEAPVTYSFYRTGSLASTIEFASVPTTAVTYSFSTPTIDDYDSQLIRVEVTESATGVAFDTDDFFGVTPGLDGWTAILINEAHTIPAQSDGTPLNFGGSGADIEIIYGGSNLLPWTGSATTPDFDPSQFDGYFSASVITSQSVNQPQKTGSIAELDGVQTYVRFGDIDFMDPAAKTGSITYKVSAYTSSYATTFREFYLKQSFSKTNDGESTFVYYITPLDGLQFKTNAQGTTIPERLIFQTQRSTGSVIQDVPSGSFDGDNFGLFYSGSNLPVSGAEGSSYYTASADDIFERAVIRYLTGSGTIGSRYIADSVSVQDLTDGQDGITPILEVSGAITFNSSSVGILPTGTSSITGSLLRVGTTLATISSSITPSSTTGFTVNAVGSSSLSVSSSWQLTADRDGTPIGYNFRFFSGSVGSYTQVGAQPFNINIDGQDGETGPSGISFTLNPPTQQICRDTGDAITANIPDITVSGSEGGTILYYDTTPVAGQFKILDLYGIPSQSGTSNPLTSNSDGSISIDKDKILVTSSITTFTGFVDIAYTSSGGSPGIQTTSFTLTKVNCFDPCSAVTVSPVPATQQISQSLDLSLETPSNFSIEVIQDAELFTFTENTTLVNKQFRIESLSQTNAGTPTTSSLGVISPATPSNSNPSEVHVLVQYQDNCGQTSDFIPVTHSIASTLDGDTGPGVVFAGTWEPGRTYQFKQNQGSQNRRDVVLWYSGSSFSSCADANAFNGYPITDETRDAVIGYYGSLKEHTSVNFNSTSPNSGSAGPPHISTGSCSGDAAWEYLGDEELFVAAKIGIFRESFIWNTLNIGTSATGSNEDDELVSANITLHGGSKNPYLSMGQGNFGNQDYANKGIFLGSGSIPGGPHFSLSGSTGHLLWDGTDLDISGVISASAGDFSGTVTVGGGDRIQIGPGISPANVSPTLSNPSTLVVRASDPSDQFFNFGFTLDNLAGTQVGETVEFHLFLEDIISSADGDSPYIVGINTAVFGVTQSGEMVSYDIPTYSDSVNNFVHFTASYAPISTGNITMNWSGELEFSATPGGGTQPFFSSSLSASVVEPSLAITNEGIFFNRGSGTESIFSLETPTGGGSGGGITISNNTNNYLLTATGGTSINGESTLQYDGTDTLTIEASTATINLGTGNNGGPHGIYFYDSDNTVGIQQLYRTTPEELQWEDSTSTDLMVLNKGGNLLLAGSGSADDFVATSDIRLKNVESYVSGGLIIVNNLTPIKYTWKDKEDTKLHIGLSAQEVLQYVPEAVYGSEETKYGVSYGKLVPVLIDAVKELTTRIEELEKQLEDRD